VQSQLGMRSAVNQTANIHDKVAMVGSGHLVVLRGLLLITVSCKAGIDMNIKELPIHFENQALIPGDFEVPTNSIGVR